MHFHPIVHAKVELRLGRPARACAVLLSASMPSPRTLGHGSGRSWRMLRSVVHGVDLAPAVVRRQRADGGCGQEVEDAGAVRIRRRLAEPAVTRRPLELAQELLEEPPLWSPRPPCSESARGGADSTTMRVGADSVGYVH
jgi:hypothetical protein